MHLWCLFMLAHDLSFSFYIIITTLPCFTQLPQEDLVACGGEDLTVSVFNVTEVGDSFGVTFLFPCNTNYFSLTFPPTPQREIEYEIEDRHEFRIKDIAVLPRGYCFLVILLTSHDISDGDGDDKQVVVVVLKRILITFNCAYIFPRPIVCSSLHSFCSNSLCRHGVRRLTACCHRFQWRHAPNLRCG